MNEIVIQTGTLQNTTAPRDYILLDGSSSMAERWWESLDAIDAYIASARSSGVKSHVTLTIFDSCDLELLARDEPMETWTPLCDASVGSHGGSTPLYDAINVLGRKIQADNPSRAAITIVTDGEENGSRFTTLDQAKAILNWLRSRGYQVTFVGCDFDNSELAKALGSSASAAIGVRKERLTDATKALGEKRARYQHSGEPMHYSENERQKFGGYLGP